MLVKLKLKNEESSNLAQYLKYVCGEIDNSYANDVDKKRNRTFWLSVSFYGCFSLMDFITDSHRKINLQPLLPISPIPSNLENFDILPPILRCFKKERGKKPIPPLQALSSLLMESGGHPHRISVLLGQLNKKQKGKFIESTTYQEIKSEMNGFGHSTIACENRFIVKFKVAQ